MHAYKKVDSVHKNGPNLMRGGVLEAYGQVVWLLDKKYFAPLILPLSGGKNTPQNAPS